MSAGLEFMVLQTSNTVLCDVRVKRRSIAFEFVFCSPSIGKISGSNNCSIQHNIPLQRFAFGVNLQIVLIERGNAQIVLDALNGNLQRYTLRDGVE